MAVVPDALRQESDAVEALLPRTPTKPSQSSQPSTLDTLAEEGSDSDNANVPKSTSEPLRSAGSSLPTSPQTAIFTPTKLGTGSDLDPWPTPNTNVQDSDSSDSDEAWPIRPLTPPTTPTPPAPATPTKESKTAAEPRLDNPVVPYREADIAIAVDVSGSTHGMILDSEKQAVQEICAHLDPTCEINILPWRSDALGPVALKDADTLSSSGGTNPDALISSPACRSILQRSKLWFLMTDGIIEDFLIRRFASNLTAHSLHGTACIIAVFGTVRLPPSSCNLSVGLSVFGVTPHCLFLYVDAYARQTYILQTKGCFSQLLPQGVENSTLGPEVRWVDLARMSLEDLARIDIPIPQQLNQDEILLQDNTRVNLTNLLSRPLDDDGMMTCLMENDDNLKTIMLAAQTRGSGPQLQQWLDSVEIKPLDLEQMQIPEINDEGSALVGKLSELWVSKGESAVAVEALQAKLRKSHHDGSKSLESRVKATEEKEGRRRSSLGEARRRSIAVDWSARNSIGRIVPTKVEFEHNKPHPPPKRQLYIRGFRQPTDPNPNLCFLGTCMLCEEPWSLLTLLLKKPPTSETTLGFPAPGSDSKLVFPLSIGNFPETDIISTFVACDPCSYQLVKRGRSPLKEPLVCALPLVSFSRNKAAWLETIKVGTQRRFDIVDIPALFLAILHTTMQRLAKDEHILLQNAIRWCSKNILEEAEMLSALSPAFLECPGYVYKPIQVVLFQNFLNTAKGNGNMYLLRYPLEGFVVACLAFAESKYEHKCNLAKRKLIVFQRLLFHLTEKYSELLDTDGPVVTQLAMAQLILHSDSSEPGSEDHPSLLRASTDWTVKALRLRLFKDVGKGRDKLSVSVKDVAASKFGLLDEDALHCFRQLGPMFSWIESAGGHAIGVFLHYLTLLEYSQKAPADHFVQLKELQELAKVFSEPGRLTEREVRKAIDALPQLDTSTE